MDNLRAGARLCATPVFSNIGDGKTYRFETDIPLVWEDVPRLYEQYATPVGTILALTLQAERSRPLPFL